MCVSYIASPLACRYDSKLVALTTMLSSTVLYNSMRYVNKVKGGGGGVGGKDLYLKQ